MIMNRMVESPLDLNESLNSRVTERQIDTASIKISDRNAFRHEHRVAKAEGGTLCMLQLLQSF
jgi:hypothetical protein